MKFINKIILSFTLLTTVFSQATNQEEMRGVWVSTVWSLDWPSKVGLSPEQQKKEFIQILDNVEEWGMNAVFVQIKPAGDAFYVSKLSPWSKYLTGTEGGDPGYDPLKFMIEEAHKRNIEFHAWFNPYRVATSSNRATVSAENIARKKPEWTVVYGNQIVLNPGIPEVNEYVTQSILEVVKNYDIDGVHLDDYFYPYPVNGKAFPDDKQYQKYGAKFSNKADWRRDNINNVVKKLYTSIKGVKKKVVFGISPFGVWRGKDKDPIRGSNTEKTLDNYDDLYADVLTWMKNGWVDYVAPQLYWHQGHPRAGYNTLVDWWSKECKSTNTDLFIGQGAYMVPNWKDPNELMNQLEYNEQSSAVKGCVFFSYSNILKNSKGIKEKLVEFYEEK